MLASNAHEARWKLSISGGAGAARPPKLPPPVAVFLGAAPRAGAPPLSTSCSMWSMRGSDQLFLTLILFSAESLMIVEYIVDRFVVPTTGCASRAADR